MSVGRPDSSKSLAQLANMFPDNLKGNVRRQVFSFELEELDVDHGIVKRIEFTEKRCNLTLKNPTEKKCGVNVRIWVLNRALIELWKNSEVWRLQSLQPGQTYLCSWEFTPQLPDSVWNEKAREPLPAWVVIDAE